MKYIPLALLIPSAVFGVSLGDQIRVLREGHPLFGQTGTVINFSEGGIALDVNGDGLFDGGVSTDTQGDNWEVVDDTDTSFTFTSSNIGQWVYASPHYYKIVSIDGTMQAETARGISAAQGNGIYIPASSEQLTIYATGKDSVWEFQEVEETDPPERTETKTWYYGYTEDFSDTGWGNVGEYRFVAKLTVTANWAGFASGNPYWSITIDDYSIVAHNIPEEHFKVGINTWRLSDIKENQPITGQTSQLGSNVYMQTISAPIPDNTTSYSNLSATRDLTLYYTITFNRLRYDGVQEEPYSFYHTIPVSIRWDYQE